MTRASVKRIAGVGGEKFFAPLSNTFATFSVKESFLYRKGRKEGRKVAKVFSIRFIFSSMYERELRRLQLDACAARVEAGERDGQTARDVRLSEKRARGGALKARHVAVRDDVRLQRREISEQVRVAEAYADDRLLAFEQGVQNSRAPFGKSRAVGRAGAHAPGHRGDDKVC